MKPFLLNLPEDMMDDLRLRSEQVGQPLTHLIRSYIQQGLKGSTISAGLVLSGGAFCSGTLFVFQPGG